MRHKIRFIQQNDSAQCGLACMAMIGRYYGLSIGIYDLESMCGEGRDGVSLKGLDEIAGQLGFSTLAARLSIAQLTECPLPAILHWNQNHFVVLESIAKSGNQFTIVDPARGRMKLTADEFAEKWIPAGSNEGIALLMEPDENFKKDKIGIGQASIGNIVSLLKEYLFRYKRYFLHLILCLTVGSILQLIVPFLTQSIVDIGIKGSNINFIWLVLLGELFIVAGKTVTDFIQSWILLHISMRMNISLISRFFAKLLKLPMKYFETKQMGDLLQRMSDHTRIEMFLTQSFLSTVFAVLNFLIFGCVLFIYDKLIFLIFLAGSVLQTVWYLAFLERRKTLDLENFAIASQNNNLTYEMLSNMQEIKLQACERRRRWEWEDLQADKFNIRMKNMKLEQVQSSGSIFIRELENILIIVIAAGAVIEGSLTLGGMMAVQYVVGQLSSPLFQLLGTVYTIQDVKLSLERINDIHQRNDENEGRSERPTSPGHRDIAVRNISFRYDPTSSKKIIDDMSLMIPEGKTTAIVGASGSGKTTLLKLLLGFFNVEQGCIRVGDNTLDEMDLRKWRSECGVVMQDGVIFSDSVSRNIASTDDEPDMERIREAARMACIDDFVGSLPQGYFTKIGKNGLGLSKGQKQRILIARAIYRNPAFILFDEATNSLDSTNELRIVENLDKFFKGKTVVIVAHRLSTVKNADNIVVLNNGRIEEQGNHSALIAQRGSYYNLVKNQLELEE